MCAAAAPAKNTKIVLAAAASVDPALLLERLRKHKRRLKMTMNLECLQAGRLCYGEDNRMLVLQCMQLYRAYPPSPEALVNPLLADLDDAVVACGSGAAAPRHRSSSLAAAKRTLTSEHCLLLAVVLRHALLLTTPAPTATAERSEAVA
jgi:hypothetical protein